MEAKKYTLQLYTSLGVGLSSTIVSLTMFVVGEVE